MARLDRTNDGDGLLIATRSHLLVNDISKRLAPFNQVGVAEMIGVEFQGVEYILAYTPDFAL